MPKNFDFAGSGFQQPFEDFDGGGLARPIGAQQAEALAGVDFQIEPANGLDVALVGFAQPPAANGDVHGLHHSGLRRGWELTCPPSP